MQKLIELLQKLIELLQKLIELFRSRCKLNDLRALRVKVRGGCEAHGYELVGLHE